MSDDLGMSAEERVKAARPYERTEHEDDPAWMCRTIYCDAISRDDAILIAEAHARAAVEAVTQERDGWRASRNAILASTNEATQRLYAARDEARAAQAKAERGLAAARELLREFRDGQPLSVVQRIDAALGAGTEGGGNAT